jgi:hypothetical protein
MTGETPMEALSDVCRTGWYGPGGHVHTCSVPWPHDGVHRCECRATLLATEPDDNPEDGS